MIAYTIQQHSSTENTAIISANIVTAIASFVSLGSIIFFCAWCYKCWKSSGDEKDGSTESDYDSSSDSQVYGIPGHKYRAYPKYASLSEGSPQAKKLDSQGYQQMKFSHPPTQEYDLQAAQPDITKIMIPPEPPLIETSPRTEDLGKIFFSISYDSDEMVLLLKILKATGLPAKDFSGTSDPFVKILLLPDKKHKMETRIKRKNLSPTWNEVFRFEGFAHSKLLSRTLYLQVLDYDRFSRNDPIGEIEIPLSDVDLGPTTLTFCKDLQPCKRQVIFVSFHPFSLSYLSESLEECIAIPRMVITPACNPYVKIYSIYGEKRLDKKKTTIKRRNKDPVWNESFFFHVPVDKVRDIRIVFTVMDFDRVTQNEMIGQVILGYRTTGTSLRHWTEMMGNPRKAVAQWHRLQIY
ncbi:PREDICTED: synaptotagmin-7-like [Acropora digitifera]|uniref:synaptotagmin-7-like n=1 Tax=Acropora digitifera TaxID=70779 RepID=UPI00077A1893|nr:PREDICTED: synaptotagmin-7-like [Acropora digitifera]